jgi:hypothetical protein
VLDTDLKTRNELKGNFLSSTVFFRELLLLIVLVITLAGIIFGPGYKLLIFSFLIILLSLVYLYLVSRKRIRELDEIQTIINNIRENKYQNEDEIKLDPGLLALQKAIKKCSLKPGRI